MCNIDFNNNQTRFVKKLSDYFGTKPVKSKEKLKNEVKQILEYFAGKRKNFNLKVMLAGSKFYTKAWLALSKVKYGETISYSELAKRAGNNKAVRAAATSCAVNPVAIIIPCHRVIAKDGSIGGFGGGLPMKKMMLKMEGSL